MKITTKIEERSTRLLNCVLGKIFLVFVTLLIVFHSEINAQALTSAEKKEVSNRLEAFGNDTVKYVYDFILKEKDRFAGKPFDSLIRNLPGPLKMQVTTPGESKRSVCESSYFSIYHLMDTEARLDAKKDPLVLVVYWTEPIPAEMVNDSLKQERVIWSDAAYRFYKNRIVKNISIVKHDLSKPRLARLISKNE